MISNKISGWYYDLQLENRLTSASLHPFCVLDGGEWKKHKEATDEKNKDFIDDDLDQSEYSKTPICKAIISEDFNVSVANSWSDFGGDMIGQMWESIKPLAPYAGAAKEMIRSAVDQYRKADADTQNRINESTVSRTLANVMIAMNDTFNDKNSDLDITDYLNRALVVQGTRFSYYSGSGTSFSNLVMKFTLFPTFKDNEYITVDKQVERILPYCIGEYVTGADGLKTDEETKKIIDGMVAWQKPPGGFKANVRDVDVVQEGTLMLRFGAYYAITNLVIENANFNFSKQMTKKPDPTLSGEIISPLYCDVTIQLRPATKYSEKSLKNFVSSRSSSNIVNEVQEDMRSKLLNLPMDNYVY